MRSGPGTRRQRRHQALWPRHAPAGALAPASIGAVLVAAARHGPLEGTTAAAALPTAMLPAASPSHRCFRRPLPLLLLITQAAAEVVATAVELQLRTPPSMGTLHGSHFCSSPLLIIWVRSPLLPLSRH